jgi:hypothetical protein
MEEDAAGGPGEDGSGDERESVVNLGTSVAKLTTDPAPVANCPGWLLRRVVWLPQMRSANAYACGTPAGRPAQPDPNCQLSDRILHRQDNPTGTATPHLLGDESVRQRIGHLVRMVQFNLYNLLRSDSPRSVCPQPISGIAWAWSCGGLTHPGLTRPIQIEPRAVGLVPQGVRRRLR